MPGPGAYRPETTGPMGKRMPPAYTFGSRHRARRTDQTPGEEDVLCGPCSFWFLFPWLVLDLFAVVVVAVVVCLFGIFFFFFFLALFLLLLLLLLLFSFLFLLWFYD